MRQDTRKKLMEKLQVSFYILVSL